MTMKHFLLAAPVMFVALNPGLTFAQDSAFDPGSKIVAGSFAYSSACGDLYEDDDERLTTLQFTPSLSVFVSPGFAVGGKFLYARSSQDQESITSWGIGPQIIYYIGGNQPRESVRGATYPYLGVAFVFTKSTYESSFLGQTEDISTSGTAFSFGFGINHMLTESVGLFGEVDYQLDSMKPEDGDSVSGNKFNIVGGFAFFLY